MTGALHPVALLCALLSGGPVCLPFAAMEPCLEARAALAPGFLAASACGPAEIAMPLPPRRPGPAPAAAPFPIARPARQETRP